MSSLYEFAKVGNDEQHLLGGVSYRVTDAQHPDMQDDYVGDAADLFEGLVSFAKAGSKLNIEHEGGSIDAQVVESFLTESTIVKGGKTVPGGCWWVTVHIPDDELWEIAKREFRGFSIEGQAEVDQ